MVESVEARRDGPLDTSILADAFPLESILCTEELHRRRSRPPDHENVQIVEKLFEAFYTTKTTLSFSFPLAPEKVTDGAAVLRHS